MKSLLGGLRLASWWLDLKAEEKALKKWIKEELELRTGGSLAHTLFAVTLLETEDIRVLRAIRDRLDHGDPISLMTLNSNVMMPLNEDALVSYIRCAPLMYDPVLSDSEVNYAVYGLELYEGITDELNGENWWANSNLLITAALRVFNECGGEPLLTIGMHGTKWFSIKLASDDTAALILNLGEERLDDIIDIMKDRKTADAGIIKAVLESDTKAISSGLL